MRDSVLDAWRAYQADRDPELLSDFLREMMEHYPPLPEHVPNPTDRIDPAGRVVYPDLTDTEAMHKGYDAQFVDGVFRYGRSYEGHFRPLGRIKPC